VDQLIRIREAVKEIYDLCDQAQSLGFVCSH
jgi:hypothetical protein